MSSELVYGLFTPECFDVFFTQHDFLNEVCLKLFISKVLSIAIMVGSLIIKVPQILKIYPSGNVAGLSGAMFVLETIGYTIVGAYSFRQAFPFSTYGENVFMILQNWLIVFLVYYYRKAIGAKFIIGSVLYFAGTVAMLNGSLVTVEIMAALQMSTIPIFAASRLPQIWQNFRNGHTGKLALITVFLAWAGSCARTFTTLQEVDDQLVLIGYLSGMALNGVLLLQIMWYWSATNKALAAAEQKRRQ
eukprot:TRINITY_DN49245_c0_g1_i1.p1 TRINITY_DN49245_c0_g1~~TRINITY_DN49245_c0_g1_i1.p1  ORF type:complete len:246 (+),score=131.80 TRINITY_DN49245_c0_g1_i1:41-778(+)